MRWTALILLVLACGPSRARLLEEKTSRYVFHRSGDELTAAITNYFEEKGYRWDPPRPNGVRRTAWKQVYGESEFATISEAYFVHVKPLGRAHATVQVVRVSQTTAGMETYHPTMAANSGRDLKDTQPAQSMGKGTSPLPSSPPVARRALDVEWQLIRRLEPDRAAALESRVDAPAAR